MPSTESIAIIDAYWARRMACDDGAFAAPSTAIFAFPADPSHRFNLIAARRAGGGCVIIVHDNIHPPIAHLAGFPADETFDADRLAQAYPPGSVQLTLLAAQAYADGGDLRDPGAGADVRMIEAIDDPALTRLREACPPEDWTEASMPEATPPLFATFSDDEIAGIAHGIAEGNIRKTGVLTHPDHRGRGHARAAAFAMARHWTAAGAVVEWQARRSNKPSLAARDALGFVERYRTILLKVG